MAFPFMSQQIVAEYAYEQEYENAISRGGLAGDGERHAAPLQPPAHSTIGPRFKVAYDPVWSYLQLDASVLAIMDTPEFQRLRDLKQLGTCYFVFPGASHNRFEHSLGVSHLSGCMIDHLISSQPGLGITNQEAAYVRIAGLVHDLGHGPFSHVFDGQFIPSLRPGRAWHHEQMSSALLDVLLDDNEVDVLDDEYESGDGDGQLPVAIRGKGTTSICGRDIVKYMLHPNAPDGVTGGPESSDAYRSRCTNEGRGLLWSNSREFLFEIVANATTGIDTDKFDYLARDSHCLGLPSSFDHRRVLYGSRVMPNGHIAYHAKETMSIAEMFHTRYRLFRTIYLHRATRSIETMICDAMREADGAWSGRISSAIDNPREYRMLTDALLTEIQYSSSNAPGLVKARSVISNIRRRRLYRFVDEILVPAEWTYKLRKFSPEDVSTHNTDPGINLRPDDIIVSDIKLGYGMGAADPISRASFWYSRPHRMLGGGTAVATAAAATALGTGGGGSSDGGAAALSRLGSSSGGYNSNNRPLGAGYFSGGSQSSGAAGTAGGRNSAYFDDEWGPVASSKISHLLPHAFEERLLRIYTRDTDRDSPAGTRKLLAIAGAFRAFLRAQGVPVSAWGIDPSSRAYQPTGTTASSVAGSASASRRSSQLRHGAGGGGGHSQETADAAGGNFNLGPVRLWSHDGHGLGLSDVPRRGGGSAQLQPDDGHRFDAPPAPPASSSSSSSSSSSLSLGPSHPPPHDDNRAAAATAHHSRPRPPADGMRPLPSFSGDNASAATAAAAAAAAAAAMWDDGGLISQPSSRGVTAHSSSSYPGADDASEAGDVMQESELLSSFSSSRRQSSQVHGHHAQRGRGNAPAAAATDSLSYPAADGPAAAAEADDDDELHDSMETADLEGEGEDNRKFKLGTDAEGEDDGEEYTEAANGDDGVDLILSQAAVVRSRSSKPPVHRRAATATAASSRPLNTAIAGRGGALYPSLLLPEPATATAAADASSHRASTPSPRSRSMMHHGGGGSTPPRHSSSSLAAPVLPTMVIHGSAAGFAPPAAVSLHMRSPAKHAASAAAPAPADHLHPISSGSAVGAHPSDQLQLGGASGRKAVHARVAAGVAIQYATTTAAATTNASERRTADYATAGQSSHQQQRPVQRANSNASTSSTLPVEDGVDVDDDDDIVEVDPGETLIQLPGTSAASSPASSRGHPHQQQQHRSPTAAAVLSQSTLSLTKKLSTSSGVYGSATSSLSETTHPTTAATSAARGGPSSSSSGSSQSAATKAPSSSISNSSQSAATKAPTSSTSQVTSTGLRGWLTQSSNAAPSATEQSAPQAAAASSTGGLKPQAAATSTANSSSAGVKRPRESGRK